MPGIEYRPSPCEKFDRRVDPRFFERRFIVATTRRSIAMPELQIVGVPQSNYVWVARIACNEKGVPYTLVPVMPHTPEVDAVHPLGKIPALRHGDVTLAESRAICFYIDHAFNGPPLVSRDPVEGARTEQWISIVNTHFDVLVARPYVGAYFFPSTADGSPNRPIIETALPKLEAQFAMLDRAVAKTGHLAGTVFTLADANVLPMLFYLSHLPESGAMLRRHASLAAYHERHMARPTVKEAVPPPFPGRSFWTIERN
jgi:glutathione S-transferase